MGGWERSVSTYELYVVLGMKTSPDISKTTYYTAFKQLPAPMRGQFECSNNRVLKRCLHLIERLTSKDINTTIRSHQLCL